MRAAQSGPVVAINIATQRCDALVLLPDLEDVIHIPLTITSERVSELAQEMKEILSSNGVRMRGERAAKKVEDEDDGLGCEQILSELWIDLVKPVLDSLAFSVWFIRI
jgi:hypothetical protein